MTMIAENKVVDILVKRECYPKTELFQTQVLVYELE